MVRYFWGAELLFKYIFSCILHLFNSDTTSVETKSPSASEQSRNGENRSLLFDDYNKTKSTLSTADYLSATRATLYAFSSQDQDEDHSQMPIEASNAPHSPIPTKMSRGKIPMETPGSMEISSNSLPIKNVGTTDQLTTVTMPTTAFASLKVDRSTMKQPIDSTRTRNHWTASGKWYSFGNMQNSI